MAKLELERDLPIWLQSSWPFPPQWPLGFCGSFTPRKGLAQRVASPSQRECGTLRAYAPVLSVQFSSSVMSNSLWHHEPQQARPLCPSPTPGVYPNSCPLSWWRHSTISSSVIDFSCRQSFPASGTFQMSQLFASGGQSTGVSASASVLPISIKGWFILGLSSLISLQSKEFSRVFSSTTIWKYHFFSAQLSLWSNSHIHTWLLEKPWLWLGGPFFAKQCLVMINSMKTYYANPLVPRLLLFFFFL